MAPPPRPSLRSSQGRQTRRTRAQATSRDETGRPAAPSPGGSRAAAGESTGVLHRLLNFARPGAGGAGSVAPVPNPSPQSPAKEDLGTPDAKRRRRENDPRSVAASAVASPAGSKRSGQSSETAVAERASEVGLVCGVCLEVMCRPATNVCGHTFCLPCLREVIERAKPPRSAVCPVCRVPLPKEASHLGENKILMELMHHAHPDVFRVGEARGARSRQADSDVRSLFEAVAQRDPAAVRQVLERSADHASIILQGSGPASGASPHGLELRPNGLGPLVAALASGEPGVVQAMVGRMSLVYGAAVGQEQLTRVPTAPPGHGPPQRYRTLLQLHMDDPGVTGFRLRNKSYLTRADFSQAAREAAGALRRNSRVTRLDLDVFGADANLDVLMSALGENRGIRILRLTVCGSFGKVCGALGKNQSLRNLILRRDDMSDDLSAGELGMEIMIFRELAGLLKVNRKIATLEMAAALRSKYWMQARPAQRKSLEKEIGAFAAALKKSVSLETISLRWDENYGEKNFEKVCNALAGLPKLCNLVVESTDISENMAKQLAKVVSKQSNSLTSLQFKDVCRINVVGLGHIMDAVPECDSLALLVLEDTSFTGDVPPPLPRGSITKLAASHIARMLARNPKLRYLVISRVDYMERPSCFGDFELAEIFSALGKGKNTHLLGLCLSGQQASLARGGAASGFAGNTSLVDLALAGNRIGKAGAREIASMLACKGNAIQRLSLSENSSLGNKMCMEVLAAGVAASPKLAHLNLDTVSLTDGGLSALLDKCVVANKAKHLTRLAIPNNNLTFKACGLLAGALAKNTVLQGLDLRSNPHIPRGEYSWLGRTATFTEHVRSVCGASLKAGRLYLRGADPSRLVDDLGDAYLLFPEGVTRGGLLIKDDWDEDPAVDPVNEFRGPSAIRHSAGRMYRSQQGFEFEDEEYDDDYHTHYPRHMEDDAGDMVPVPMALQRVIGIPGGPSIRIERVPDSDPLSALNGSLAHSIMALFRSPAGQRVHNPPSSSAGPYDDDYSEYDDDDYYDYE